VEFSARFPLKLGSDWKTFLASPIEASLNFPAVVLASAPQLFHPAIFNEGILSGRISLSQNLEHPNLTGEAQLLNGVLQNAALDLQRASGRVTFNGDHATVDFLNGSTKDVDVSVQGDLDFRSSGDVHLKISSAAPIFDMTANVQDCVRRIEFAPVEVTLAATIDQIEFEGDVFNNNWKIALKEKGTTSATAINNPLIREFHCCTGPTPPGDVFTMGVRPRPEPAATPAKPRKRTRSR
jgi:autotransporter translocation and assembly factor TamB